MRSPQFLLLCSCVSRHIEILQLRPSISDDIFGEINAVNSAFISLHQESECTDWDTWTVCQNQMNIIYCLNCIKVVESNQVIWAVNSLGIYKAIVKFSERIEALIERIEFQKHSWSKALTSYLLGSSGTWAHYCAMYNNVKHLLIEILLKTLQQWAG
jgi:hypothetical protein